MRTSPFPTYSYTVCVGIFIIQKNHTLSMSWMGSSQSENGSPGTRLGGGVDRRSEDGSLGMRGSLAK